MNNEPVAWINREEGSGSILDWEKDPYSEVNIPLYTHPVKEQDTDCQYCKQGCIRCDARKQLTDEEINKIYLEKYDGHMGFLSPDEVREFARTILRKAQEK